MIFSIVIFSHCTKFSDTLIYRNEFEADKTLTICERVFTGNPITLFSQGQIGRNAKFLLTLIYKNYFWVERVAKDEGSRVLINPDMADSCQQETPFPPTAFLWFGFSMIPGQY